MTEPHIPHTDLPTVIRICIMDGTEFTSTKRSGRPSAFCSDACRTESKKTTTRICTVCLDSYDFNAKGTRPPFYCSEKCAGARLCSYCHLAPITSKDPNIIFCSSACQMKANEPRAICRTEGCDKKIPQPAKLTRWPKYCSDRCRHDAYFARKPELEETITAPDVRLMKKLSRISRPYNYFPLTRYQMSPFAPPKEELSLRLQQNIAWWSRELTRIHDRHEATGSASNKELIHVLSYMMSRPHLSAIDSQRLETLKRLWPYVGEHCINLFGHNVCQGAWWLSDLLIDTMPTDARQASLMKQTMDHIQVAEQLMAKSSLSDRNRKRLIDLMGKEGQILRTWTLWLFGDAAAPSWEQIPRRNTQLEEFAEETWLDMHKRYRHWTRRNLPENWYTNNDCPLNDRILYDRSHRGLRFIDNLRDHTMDRTIKALIDADDTDEEEDIFA